MIQQILEQIKQQLQNNPNLSQEQIQQILNATQGSLTQNLQQQISMGNVNNLMNLFNNQASDTEKNNFSQNLMQTLMQNMQNSMNMGENSQSIVNTVVNQTVNSFTGSETGTADNITDFMSKLNIGGDNSNIGDLFNKLF